MTAVGRARCGRSRSRWIVAFCTAACAFSAGAQQGYPGKPIWMIVPLAPGGPSDILARTMAQKLTESLKQSVVVDKRTGLRAN